MRMNRYSSKAGALWSLFSLASTSACLGELEHSELELGGDAGARLLAEDVSAQRSAEDGARTPFEGREELGSSQEVSESELEATGIAEDEGELVTNSAGTGILSLDDPGFKGIHRLNSREYNNSARDLFGFDVKLATSFLNETAHGFDNNASAMGMTPAQYSAYFAAAEGLADDLGGLADESILDCDSGDSECADALIQDFGLRTFRRPLSADERATYRGVYDRAIELGLEPQPARAQVVRALLASAEFLYRVEIDQEPSSSAPHNLSGFELTSRLSYFLWSTTPDEGLLQAAADGSLQNDTELDSQVERMLQDTKSGELVHSFAWQWLGLEGLESHAVLNEAFPEWDDSLRSSMLQEASLYLEEFVQGRESFEQFLTADFHFVDSRLAEHYGVRAPADNAFERRETSEGRRGFLGLGSFLTLSSFAHRTSPTLRAKLVLEELLCAPPPPPPAALKIPELDAEDAANQAASIENVRARLELHRSEPTCAACHATLDPLGLALEHFDGIGRYRDSYENGDIIDSSGVLPDGTSLNDLQSLAEVVQGDDRFYECAVEKVMTYALGRGVGYPDSAHVAAMLEAWGEDNRTIPDLIGAVIHSVPFRQRRGEDNEQ